MKQKKEMQEKIIKITKKSVKDEELLTIIKQIAPGKNLRAALDGALKTQKGALIVIESGDLSQILEGGFRINTKFTPQKLIELSKMDGAIVLSKDMKKINYANVLLTPDHKIKSQETGTRHKAAERTAKQAETLVIAISERKHEINLFYKNIKYLVINTEELLRKTNENIQLLEKQRELFDTYIKKLNIFEINNIPSLKQSVQVIQRGLMIQKIANNLKKHILELGKEGAFLKVRRKELIKNVEKETELTIKDYTKMPVKISKTLLEDLTYDEIIDNEHIFKILGYADSIQQTTTIKGWRILDKTSLHDSEIALITNEAESLKETLKSPLDFFTQMLDKNRAQDLIEELEKIKTSGLN